MAKGEIVNHEHFLHLQQCFEKLSRNAPAGGNGLNRLQKLRQNTDQSIEIYAMLFTTEMTID